MQVETPSNVTADAALERLVAGNERFVHGESIQPESHAERRKKLVAAQAPFAVVLTCSDSRVVPELIFDQGIGDLFVLRVAGHIVDVAVLGSIEYAVGVLGVQLVVVMGHQGCGAVRAAMQGAQGETHLDEIIRSIGPAVERSGGDLETAIRLNADNMAGLARSHENVLGPALAEGKLEIVSAYYALATGRVELIEPIDAGERLA